MRKLRKTQGSLTVETILALPLCMMVIVIVMSYFQILQTELQLQNALEQTIQQQAIYAGVQETYDPSYLGAEGEFLLLCQAGGVEFDRIESGALGLHLILSAGDEIIEGTLVYRVQLPFLTGAYSRILCVQNSVCRIWNGSSCQETQEENQVYYTEYGTVYHRYLDCTHLKLSIVSVKEEELSSLRNESGGRYSACEICGEEQPEGSYYVTGQGDCYHSRLTCPGLSRYIHTASLETVLAQGRRECSRCAARASQAVRDR